MRPPELETKLETGAFGPDVLYTRYGDSPANAVCIAPRTMPTAPGDALKIVKWLELYPDLVEACEALCESLRSQRSGSVPTPISVAAGAKLRACEAILARCKEVDGE